MSETKAERIPAAERREQILDAAARVFGERGYAGATTDQVAQVAGISQPYVVRMFGSKEKLFNEVLDRAGQRLETQFRAAVAEAEQQGLSGKARNEFLGLAYLDLVEEGGIVLPLMQAFLLGHDPAIGSNARDGFIRMYRVLRDDAGLGAEGANDFLARGMLINTLLTMRMADLYDANTDARELIDDACGSKATIMLDATKAGL
ncbi:TetR/AcrR family transcriptional regulator [Gryllotalpicola reticulitermitis]|uniref:TetR/AcrR family transcriptional regulator n=1 Tax=Gryllotalpicola reticulitermitis TaxID=1184153 RepID=A0ABV8Q5G7_9MICO